MADVDAAVANGTFDAAKMQYEDKKTGRIYFLCFK
jgi:hypothetical protein